MRTKIIVFLLAVLTFLGGLNLFQSLKERFFPDAMARTEEATIESVGKIRVRNKNREEIKVRESDYWGAPAADAFISLTRVEDDELKSEAFTLDKSMAVHIFALGEGVGREMYDYAWIVDAETGRPVWVMRYRDTDDAGGGDKNRVFDGQIRLEAGSYRVYYATDGSHSYGDWNVSAPENEEYWGVSLYPEDGGLKSVTVGAPESGDRYDVLAELVQIRDDEHESTRFRLKETTTIHIYALGEGDWTEMYDAAWIEDRDTGREVWEMTYRKTDHAGGARKNRLFDGTISLPAGDYELHYESDGSHSFEEWNAELPWDPYAWGVTLTRVVDNSHSTVNPAALRTSSDGVHRTVAV